MIQVLITITSAGSGFTGSSTFSLIALPSNSVIATGVTLTTLQGGYTASVPIGTTTVRVQATNSPGCTNYVDVAVSVPTTTTTTAAPTTTTTAAPTTTTTTLAATTTTTTCFPLGNPYVVGVGNTTGAACTDLNDSPITVYSTSGTFTPGMILYTDECMTTLLTGFDYIVLQSTIDIFNLNDVTGELGADTGLDC